MAGLACSEFDEVQEFLMQRYPGRLPHEAYAEFLDEAINKYPAEIARIKPYVGPAVDRAIVIAEIYAAAQSPFTLPLAGLKTIQLTWQDGEAIYKYLCRTSQAAGGKIDGDIDAVAKQLTLEILRKFTSATEGVSNRTAGVGETMSASVSFRSQNLRAAAGPDEQVIKPIDGVHFIRGSLIDYIRYHGPQMVEAIQRAEVIKALKGISNELRDGNSLKASGGGGPDGYAWHIYAFIKMKIVDEIEKANRSGHRFFLYHPETTWYPAFHRLIREEPLPTEFCVKGSDLDTLCLAMQEYRRRLVEESDCGRKIVFHLLIQSWYEIAIHEPLYSWSRKQFTLHTLTDKFPSPTLKHANLILVFSPVIPAGLCCILW